MHKVIDIDTRAIRDWESFHDVFKEALGFPDFYGRNMDAWIDCLTYLDDPKDRMTSVHVPEGGVLVISLSDARDLASRCPDIYEALVECAAFVNYRRLEAGGLAVLTLAFFKRAANKPVVSSLHE